MRLSGIVRVGPRVLRAGTLALLGWGTLALAHTHLLRSSPSNGSTVAAPARFVLTFAEPAKLTALALQKDAEPARKLGPLPAQAAAEISIPAPPLAPGHYTLTWRVVGDDGHVMPGKLSFTVGAPAAWSPDPAGARAADSQRSP